MAQASHVRIRRGAALLQLFGLPLLLQADATKRHWAEINALVAANASVVTKDGLTHRGHLLVNGKGAVLIPHGTYERWIKGPVIPAEISKESIARIVVRRRYKLTKNELDDKWWYVCANWKGIFYPELSNLFPIAIVAHTGYTGWTIAYTPIAAIAGVLRPPVSETIEILPD